MSSDAMSPRSNALLRVLPPDAIGRFKPEYQHVSFGELLTEPFEPLTHIYFPTTAIITAVGTTENGGASGLGIFGGEAAMGLDTLTGAEWSAYGKMVQQAGGVVRVRKEAVKKEFDENTKFREAVLSSAHMYANQVSQTSLCNRLHNVDERLARWLLLSHDRVNGDVFHITHQFLAIMLGASRVRVTQAARRLQDTGCISYRRGNLAILDRRNLQATACECYKAIRRAYKKV